MKNKTDSTKANGITYQYYDDYGVQTGRFRDNDALMIEARAVWDSIPDSQHQAEDDEMRKGLAEIEIQDTADISHHAGQPGKEFR